MLDWHKSVTDALRTDLSPEQYVAMGHRLQNLNTLILLHASLGLCTEVGEIQDQLKRHLVYGKDLDFVNLLEEGGDVSWYLRLLAGLLHSLKEGWTFEQMIQSNIDKLKARFPDKFTEQKALNRDLNREREVLERK